MHQSTGNAMTKEYEVTIKVTFTKKYYVNALDYEQAEEQALDESWHDNYSVNEHPDLDVYDINTA